MVAYLETTANIEKDITMLHNRVGSMAYAKTLRTKRSQLYQLCADDADVNEPMAPSSRRTMTVHPFEDSARHRPRHPSDHRSRSELEGPQPNAFIRRA